MTTPQQQQQSLPTLRHELGGNRSAQRPSVGGGSSPQSTRHHHEPPRNHKPPSQTNDDAHTIITNTNTTPTLTPHQCHHDEHESTPHHKPCTPPSQTIYTEPTRFEARFQHSEIPQNMNIGVEDVCKDRRGLGYSQTRNIVTFFLAASKLCKTF